MADSCAKVVVHSGRGDGDGGDNNCLVIYHEKSQSVDCGQHLVNNLVQGPVFDVAALADIAAQMNQTVDSQGNVSILVVLNEALKPFRVSLRNVRACDVQVSDVVWPSLPCRPATPPAPRPGPAAPDSS